MSAELLKSMCFVGVKAETVPIRADRDVNPENRENGNFQRMCKTKWLEVQDPTGVRVGPKN